ncbi:MAG: phosphatase PAP2 family protein [Phycisphaerales bacterium]
MPIARSIRVWNHPMDRSPLRIARDYNRGLSPEMRAVHIGAAWMRGALRPVTAVVCDPRRRAWAVPVALGAVGFVVVYPMDGALSRWLRAIPLGGDVKRELTAWQQYGALTSLVVTGVIIALLDGRRWRRVLDLGAAAILTVLACNVMKNVVGRPRPVLGDPRTILGPWGMYPVPVVDAGGKERMVLTHAWGGAAEVKGAGAVGRVGYELWSMPSSHTAGAVVLSFFLAALYPRLRPVAIVLAVMVGLARVITGAHWPSDVILGAALGYAIAAVVMPHYLGIRAVDWAWRKAIDPQAAPTALPLR